MACRQPAGYRWGTACRQPPSNYSELKAGSNTSLAAKPAWLSGQRTCLRTDRSGVRFPFGTYVFSTFFLTSTINRVQGQDQRLVSIYYVLYCHSFAQLEANLAAAGRLSQRKACRQAIQDVVVIYNAMQGILWFNMLVCFLHHHINGGLLCSRLIYCVYGCADGSEVDSIGGGDRKQLYAKGIEPL